MLVSDLAEASGLPIRAVRFYERRGLLPDAPRNVEGVRVYGEATLDRLGFIRSAQTAGLTLAEIASVIDIRDNGEVPCRHSSEALSSRLADIRERRAQLAAIECELENLADGAGALDPADCRDGEGCHFSSSFTAASTKESWLA
ncbi:MAG: MerR family DNA-binding protein [Acidimicrobiia bacterium]|nr:MerR family DNA-binding protein [Acidimicrobiia bacterium]